MVGWRRGSCFVLMGIIKAVMGRWGVVALGGRGGGRFDAVMGILMAAMGRPGVVVVW